MKRFHIFDNAKQTRQFWTLACSATIIGLAGGEIQEVTGTHQIFVGMILIASIIIIGFNLKEINDEAKSTRFKILGQEYEEDSPT